MLGFKYIIETMNATFPICTSVSFVYEREKDSKTERDGENYEFM